MSGESTMEQVKQKASELASAVLPETGPEGPLSGAVGGSSSTRHNHTDDDKDRSVLAQTRQESQPEDELKTRDGMTADSWKVKEGAKDGDRYTTTEINGAQPKVIH